LIESIRDAGVDDIGVVIAPETGGEIQQQVVLTVPPPLRVVVYRRLMVRIAERIARLHRVSVVTAVSPRAAVDLAFVLFAALGMIRRLAALYGGRPGFLGMIRLVRHIIAHLTVTGALAAGDSLIQQMLGHGIAAKLSARLGEGVLNGLLTARLGLAAIEVARPLPFAALPKPVLSDIAGDLLRRRETVGEVPSKD
jgi:uncharacterized protein (TIGR01620 family)